MNAFQIHFDPLLPDVWLWTAVTVVVLITALSVAVRKKALVLRLMSALIFMGALMNPSLVEEMREAVKDVAVVVVDESSSQSFGQRAARTDAMLTRLQSQFEAQDSAELRVVRAPLGTAPSRDTQLFDALDQALADVPVARRAGVIFLSDGQIHDVPTNPELFSQYGPVHVVLTGEQDERDRQVVIVEAPAYGITGQSVAVKFKITDSASIADAENTESYATITINGFEGEPEIMNVPVGEEQIIDLPVRHSGQNVFEIAVDGIDDEITLANNKAALIVNGVRDRLKVLLVSGRPHAGGRTWRDLLKSDPGVDLVHFTILREPTKLDATPQNELSLIAFPFRELFEIKLYDFDLIVFDRYSLNRILPDHYFQNIVRYVEQGGALLVSSGPDFTGYDSLYATALAPILPGQPSDQVFKKPFVPALNDDGRIHPVTMNLQSDSGKTEWGPWLRQVELTNDGGDVLMTGANNAPLLILDRVKEGRVAQLASDHIWLWSRGYKGGGPSIELLRRIVHWLMKEPELDEEALSIETNGTQIIVKSRHFSNRTPQITMTTPGGAVSTIELKETSEKTYETRIEAEEMGIYSFEDDKGQRRFAVIGDNQPPEFKAVITTDAVLKPLIDASKGGVYWAEKAPDLNIDFFDNPRSYARPSTIGLRSNHDYLVSGVQSTALLPPWAAAIILLMMVAGTWWREGKEH